MMITGFWKINKPSFAQSQFANEHKLYVFQVVGFLPTFLFYFSCNGMTNGLLNYCAKVIICNIIYISFLENNQKCVSFCFIMRCFNDQRAIKI